MKEIINKKAKNTLSNCNNNISIFNRSLIGVIILVILFTLLLFITYNIYNSFVYNHNSKTIGAYINKDIYAPLDELYSGQTIKTVIQLSPKENLVGVGVDFYMRDNVEYFDPTNTITIDIIDQNNNLIFSEIKSFKEIKDDPNHIFEFPQTINSNSITVQINVNSNEKNALSIYKNLGNGIYYINNVQKEGLISCYAVLKGAYCIPFPYYVIVYMLVAIPLFLIIIFKLELLTNFWTINSVNRIDFIFWGIILFFCYLSFTYPDINVTAILGKDFIDILFNGNPLDFYDYTEKIGVYLIPTYILYGIWSLPVIFVYKLFNLQMFGVVEFDAVKGLLLYWYKLLAIVFYLASTYVIYKIGLVIKLSNNTSKWLSFVYLIQPMAVFSQFVFGQYDSIYIFFMLLMLYYFLKKNVFLFSLFASIACTFKLFPLLIFIPLLLLVEKRLFYIIKYFFIGISGIIICNLFFVHSEGFSTVSQFSVVMLNRLMESGLDGPFNIKISLIGIAMVIICIFAYDTNLCLEKDSFKFYKYATYIPLFVFSIMFCFISWHPQWLITLVPFLCITSFINKKIKSLLILMIIISVAWMFSSGIIYANNVEANLTSFGIFRYVFKWDNLPGLINYYSLLPIYRLGGVITPSITMTIFIGSLLSNLVIAFPSIRNLQETKPHYEDDIIISRGIIWLSGLCIFIYILPTILLYFVSGSKL